MDSSASFESERLREFLKERRFACVSEIRAARGGSVNFVLIVPGDRVSRRAGRGQTSLRQMKQIRAEIKKRLKIAVEWIVTQDSRIAALESALLEALKMRFPDMISSVLVSTAQILPVWVWVDLAPGVASRPSEEIVGTVATDLFRAFGLEAPVVVYSDSPELPSNPMILRCLKVNAPVTTEVLLEKLRQSGALVPDSRWLQTKLDTLRRNGLAVRAHEGTYALTESGLALVPHGRTRSSSDVQRALALGRRKWQ